VGDPGVGAAGRGTETLEIPKSKGCGTRGTPTVVETNYLSLDLSSLGNKVVYHYGVKFEPALSKRLRRYV
jgi:hypothetical protein